jgi:hypothetical protein
MFLIFLVYQYGSRQGEVAAEVHGGAGGVSRPREVREGVGLRRRNERVHVLEMKIAAYTVVVMRFPM